MFTTHGHWFVRSGTDVQEPPGHRPQPSCYGPLGCYQCAVEVAQATGREEDVTHAHKLGHDSVYGHHAAVMAERQALARMATESSQFAAVAQNFSAAPPVPAVSSSTGVLEVPVDDLRDWYERYLEAKDAEAKIKDVVAEARSVFLEALARNYADLPDKVNMTIGGRPVLQRHVVIQNRVDTTKLRAEQPALAQRYNKEVRQEQLKIL